MATLEKESNGKAAPTSAPAKSVDSGAPIIARDEVQRFIDLGLGRGLDMTDPDLWRNKCAFVVRYATFENVIGTDEGNLAEDYRQTISSGNDMQQQCKESVLQSATTPIQIVLEASGTSRSATSTKIVKGQRVITRTVSFNSTNHHSKDKKCFEDVLSKWVKKHNDMNTGCEQFVRYFGITHYVTSITLGASVHSIFTEEEHAREVEKKKKKSGFKRKFKEAKGAVTKLTSDIASEVTDNVTAKLTTEVTEDTIKHSRVRKLGVMKDNTVERGSTDEAVIGIRILPILSLIDNKELREALRAVLLTYTTKNRGYASTGPYIVECEDEGLYWKVNEIDNTLTATKILAEASYFRIIPDEDDDDDPYDFYIGWEKVIATLTVSNTGSMRRKRKSLVPEQSRDSVLRYLQVNDRPESKGSEGKKIQMKTCVRGSTLCIYKPLIKDDEPSTRAELSQWLTKRSVFFVQSFKNNQYLSVHKSDGEDEYEVQFIKGSQLQDDINSTWSLFRLLPINDDLSSESKSTCTF